MAARFVAAIDQGTTSSRCMVFDAEGRVVAQAQRPHAQIHQRPGWVEHDGLEIWANVEAVVAEALDRAGAAPGDLAAVGIANQRETTLVWERDGGRPIANAVVWQDLRTAELAEALRRDGGEALFRRRTGLPPATYFSGPKIRWLLDAIPGARARADAGELLFGTMDSWLVWNLTGEHVTDVTNASRTLLMDLTTLDWDEALLERVGVPRRMLPKIRSSSEVYGPGRGGLAGVPIAGVLGDQQAALFGQACFREGEAKCTYGTGAFLLANTGARPATSDHGLIATVAYKLGDAPAAYALEGSVAVAGSLVQWLRDALGLIPSAEAIEALAASVPDTGGCCLVPAFSGLFAPHWRPDARGAIVGLTAYVTAAHIGRAALEATAWQVVEIVEAMAADAGRPLERLQADGGMTANALLMQIQADALGVPVVRPRIAETTSLGAAYAAGLAVGFWSDLDALRAHAAVDREWRPATSPAAREAGLARWRKAVARTLDWA